MITRQLLDTGAFVLSWAIALGWLSANAGAAADPPASLEDLHAAMQQVIDRDRLPGAGVALVADGEVLWCGGFGKADLAADVEIDCDTQFRVGSISKTFIALAMLRLAEDGRIDLDAHVADVAPEVRIDNRWDATNPVTVATLLEHTAGFDDMTFGEVYNRSDPDIPLRAVFEKFPEPQRVRWPPGTQTSYSNPGYGVAGFLVEKVSGQPWTDYVRTTLLVPLGITVGDFDLTAANRAALAQGYRADREPVPYREIYLRPAGDLKASPREMARLVQFFLDRGSVDGTALVPAAAIDRMEFPRTPLSARHGLRLGYGLGNYADVRGGVTTHGHDGGIDGFLSSFRYMPSERWGYVVLVNSDAAGKAAGDLTLLATEFLSKAFARVAPAATTTVDTRELEHVAGYYTPRAPRNQLLAFLEDLAGGLVIRVEDGRLTRAHLFGQHEPLHPMGNGRFRAEQDPEATVLFFEDQESAYYSAYGDERISLAERVNPIWPCARIAILAISVALMVSALLFGAVWILRLVFGRMKGVAHIAVRALPLAACLVLLGTLFAGAQSFQQIGQLGFFSVLVFVGTLVFPILAVLGAWFALRVPRAEIDRRVHIHSLLVSIACVVIAAFFAAWHLIGLRMWG